jgi:hypothetical protein
MSAWPVARAAGYGTVPDAGGGVTGTEPGSVTLALTLTGAAVPTVTDPETTCAPETAPDAGTVAVKTAGLDVLANVRPGQVGMANVSAGAVPGSVNDPVAFGYETPSSVAVPLNVSV